MKPPYREPGNASIVILVLLVVAGIAQCGRERTPQDACGGSGSRPVTIGGSMVVGCR